MTRLADPVGAVLVVGGGIAGIQAALDLADGGFQVQLVESSPAIGGSMAQLDKTFPTNDCSMCILSPKVVECARHLNIHLMTYSELEALEGEAGHFRARIRHKPRLVDPLKCTACNDCTAACPVEVPSEFDHGTGMRKAIYRPYPQAVPNVFAIDKRGVSPCKAACPAGTSAQGYIALIATGRYAEALALSRRANPFTSVCGRVCYHPCETACSRQLLDGQPLAIAELKRFVADWGATHGDVLPARAPVTRAERVAIVGSGPAGLTAAHDLALLGYAVTVFEAQPLPGGMLRYGIPDYRLPPAALDQDIARILALGVELRCNARVSDLDALQCEFPAVLLAVGAHASTRLRAVGEDLAGVQSAVDLLQRVNSGERPQIGQRVMVVGGGNTAIDAARCARRLGADVTILYRRSRAEMPAYAFEVDEAEQEGVRIGFLTDIVRILGEDGRVTGVEVQRMHLGGADASGRRRPIPIEGTNTALAADAVILAIGQAPDTAFLPRDVTVARGGAIEHDVETCATHRAGVFTAGDAATGPRSAIEAVGMGHRAAEAIHRHLSGERVELLPRIADDQIVTLDRGEVARRAAQGLTPRRARTLPAGLSAALRLASFDEVSRGFTEEQARAEAERCLNCAVCSECYRCVEACKPDAIDHSMVVATSEIEVGAVILAPGFDTFDPTAKYELGYSRFPDVVTSIEFERLLSASGPCGGHVERPSDSKPPRRIAFLQCVGSRDVQCHRAYCSSVCCMAAIKEAVIAREHDKGIEATIFFMEMRAFGKDFDRYYERARDEFGVRFVRGRVAKVDAGRAGALDLAYVAEGDALRHEQYDLVVLSVGLEPSRGTKELIAGLGLRATPEGFVHTPEFAPLATSRAGVFVCGAASGPKDIPETVTQASAAAAEAAALLAPARGTLARVKEYPPERDVEGEPPRIGVFVCHCGINIAGTVDVEAVQEYALTLPYVVYAGRNLFTCSQDTQESMKEIIARHQINRVVVSSCSPRTHEALFQETIREVGLNPHLFELANIRDQCAWVHQGAPQEATAKAMDLVRMAVQRVVEHTALHGRPVAVTHSALVLGGGVTGMTAALGFAAQGYDVYLIEREAELGGHARHLQGTLRTPDVQRWLDDLIRRVASEPRVHVHLGAELTKLDGFVGNFESALRTPQGEEKVAHGVAVVATGGEERRTAQYLYGQDARVVTQRELEEMLAEEDHPSPAQTHPLPRRGRGSARLRVGVRGESVAAPRVVMIQCVESRTAEHPYCSRVCCSQALKNAIALKERWPDCQVTVLYRDIRSYGLRERYYQQARALGVLFVHYEPEAPPRVEQQGGALVVRAWDATLGQELTLPADLLALSVGIAPRVDAVRLGSRLKVPLNADGFFLEAHMKLRPVDFATEGIYLAGMAHAPKFIEESLAQAQAAVARACTVLAKEELMSPGAVAHADPFCCVACGDCERVCPYSAIQIVTKEVARRQFKECAEVNPALCKACGACAAACRSGCIALDGFDDRQIMAQIQALVAAG